MGSLAARYAARLAAGLASSAFRGLLAALSQASAQAALRQARRARAELEGWAAAVAHLHSLGLPAAVPEFAAAWLARQGVRADWVVTA